MDFRNHPHRRFNPLSSEWVLVSPHRNRRPWQGLSETPPRKTPPSYDPNCHLCPGNRRAGGKTNPEYENVYVFENDFSALLPDTPTEGTGEEYFFQVQRIEGICKVLCFSPRHDLTLAEMPVDDIRAVVDAWARQSTELGKQYRWVQIFENKGELMGCSNPHPHCQIWAVDCLPNVPQKEGASQRRYARTTGGNLLLDYVKAERQYKERMVMENDLWSVVVPFWALWPFETLLVLKHPARRMPELSEEERNALADILKRHLRGYDRLFKTPFPYTMGWHGAPFQTEAIDHWQLHAHFYPPLLRSATVRKFMVGYEMLAEAQRDTTPEQAAAILRKIANEKTVPVS